MRTHTHHWILPALAMGALLCAPGCQDPSMTQGLFSIDPTAVDLGDVPVSQYRLETVEVENKGEGPLEIKSIKMVDDDGGRFQLALELDLEDFPFVLDPEEKSVFGVEFSSDDGGMFQGTVEVIYHPLPSYLGGGRPVRDVDAGAGPQVFQLPLSASVGAGVDMDGDGWTIEDGDCDDNNPDVYPGAPELCDGLDSNCDGVIPFD